MTVLTAIQEACPDLGLPRPLSAMDASNPNAVRLLDFAHDAGDDIARRGDWAGMMYKVVFTGYSQAISLTSSFARLAPGGAVNLLTPAPQRIRGPLSSDQLAQISAGAYGATSRLYYSMEANRQLFLSRALDNETIEALCIRRVWMVNVSTYKERATMDSDTCLFPERLLTKAIIWRFRRESGLPYEDQLAEWEADLAMELRQDRGVTT